MYKIHNYDPEALTLDMLANFSTFTNASEKYVMGYNIGNYKVTYDINNLANNREGYVIQEVVVAPEKKIVTKQEINW